MAADTVPEEGVTCGMSAAGAANIESTRDDTPGVDDACSFSRESFIRISQRDPSTFTIRSRFAIS